MVKQAEKAIQHILAALQAASIYSTNHKVFLEAVERAYKSIWEILEKKRTMVIGLVGEEIAYGSEILFDITKKAQTLIQRLKELEIERISLGEKLTQKELGVFLGLLATSRKMKPEEFQSALSARGIQNIFTGKLTIAAHKTGNLELNATSFMNYLNKCDKDLDKLSETVDALLNHEAINFLDLRLAASSIMENLVMNYSQLLKLTTVKNYDLVTFAHILNVSILSMFFSSRLGYTREDVLSIGLAALFHDIGKVYIARKIIKKTDRLQDEEFETIKGHSSLGARILLHYVDTLGMLPVVVAYEHHVRYDRKGYPAQIHCTESLHPASLIVSICDVYDALTQKRSYKQNFPPNLVYQIMIKEKGTMFHPDLLESFFQSLGVWPVGMIVALTDGAIAVVREQNEDNIWAPRVEILHPARTGAILDLRKTGSKLRIEYSLDPMGEGRKFVDMI